MIQSFTAIPARPMALLPTALYIGVSATAQDHTMENVVDARHNEYTPATIRELGIESSIQPPRHDNLQHNPFAVNMPDSND